MKKRLLRIFLIGVIGFTFLCAVTAGLLALNNRTLPTHSQITAQLPDLEKARLAEAFHLRQALGDEVWPGWGTLDIPIIVYNEEYAFLVEYPNPPDGWIKVPQNDARGGAWEPVPGDTFGDQVYYRQPLPGNNLTPENFTVLVGQRWVATMETKEYMEIHFYEELRDELPAFLQPVFPFRLFWNLLIDSTETYLGALQHEAFHALQGHLVPTRLADAEMVNQFESQYPWDDPDLRVAWQDELDTLFRAVQAPSNEAALKLVRQFLALRDDRRAGLSQDLIAYERQREWLEGLAKYAELSLGRLAGNTPDYTFLPALLEDDPDFKAYTTREQYWAGQLAEVRRTSGRSGETRFYYSGMAQAVLLDRLFPGWKAQAFDPDVMLEDLLRKVAE